MSINTTITKNGNNIILKRGKRTLWINFSSDNSKEVIAERIINLNTFNKLFCSNKSKRLPAFDNNERAIIL